LALGIFATNTGGYAFTFWLPTAVRGVSGASTHEVLWSSGLVYACGLIAVFLSGQSSDRTGDRKWHCVAGQLCGALFLSLSTIPGQPFWLVMTWLCATGLAANFWPSPFWALPTLTLGAAAAAVSIGFINMCANLAGFLGNHQVGWLKGHGFSDRVCLLFLAGCYLLGGVLISLVRVPSVRKVSE
jgi:ACS family tartrate transporter-like MFS transporter